MPSFLIVSMLTLPGNYSCFHKFTRPQNECAKDKFVHTHTQRHTHTCTHTHVHTQARTHAHKRIHTRTHMKHAQTHTHLHARTCTHIHRVGQNRIHTLFMTVDLMISLPKIPYIHRIWFWPTLLIHKCTNARTQAHKQACKQYFYDP